MGLEDYPGLRRVCDRCGIVHDIEKLREQKGLYVCERCYNEPGYEELNVDFDLAGRYIFGG